ncbi:NAD(P)-dependent dehydrogenase (short-subunit alcohol dehydrogenase family) [Streptomyces sp. 2333.5]|uniref:SDR family oxidoreductase n=1 Tax=Streptomyces TaxID=1883 RepID=UPI00089AB445|nr:MULTISPECIES: SDR family oxidoreductase [unclassified Streptomyces]PJJ01521.1 NAD(P)-dependent dehydrogenase (short-subunit alcohol dehydrogenase family) [Streptomyces sp. 2333.5]SEC66857.1 NAD(P)-dependent dehydrogenase, short-chain alcohol dehydrogenase family [Streptomyces sp. 2314.4]SED44945.1 NAD(P)-dependent dehydrogenase, short-chain alcohol dehydrogenase family [Streptomyces sp. 2112.2]
MTKELAGRVALVAGATRGAGRAMAVELGRAGALVYVTGRTTRERVSEVGRATETIEETAELVTAAGGTGIAVPTDHLEPEQVKALVERIDRAQGRLDVLVNSLWGGDRLIEFDTRLWDLDLAGGLRMLRLGIDSHLITGHYALPLLIRRPGGLVVEITDGTADFNRRYRDNLCFDLTKNAPHRIAFGLAAELREHGGTAVSLTPGFLRSEAMLDHFGVTEETWSDAVAKEPHFAIAESPALIARGVRALAADPDKERWSGCSLSSGQLAKEYGFTDTDGSRPDCFGYFDEVVFGGRDATAADYR